MAMPHALHAIPVRIMKLSTFYSSYYTTLGWIITPSMPRRQELTHLTASELDQLKYGSAVVKNQHIAIMYYS